MNTFFENIKNGLLEDDNKYGLFSDEEWNELKTTYLEGDKYWNTEMPVLDVPEGVCDITRRVIDEYNASTAEEFWNKNACSKYTYARRVRQYGDPFMKSPLSRGRSEEFEFA